MTPQDVKQFYGNTYLFHKQTGMSNATLGNWLKWGFVPVSAQLKLERMTHGVLKADWPEEEKNASD